MDDLGVAIGSFLVFIAFAGVVGSIGMYHQTGDRTYLHSIPWFLGILPLLWLFASGYWVLVVVIGLWGYILKDYFLGFFEKKKPNAPQGGAKHKGKSSSNFRKKSGN